MDTVYDTVACTVCGSTPRRAHRDGRPGVHPIREGTPSAWLACTRHCPLLAFTPQQEVRSQLSMTWGTETFIIPIAQSNTIGTTNLIRVHRRGEASPERGSMD